MTTIQTATATLPVSSEVLYAFLADLSKHGAFLEPTAMNFQGQADKHHRRQDAQRAWRAMGGNALHDQCSLSTR